MPDATWTADVVVVGAGFAGLTAARHLTRLGITTVELMPSAAWVDERHLPPLNRSNYWGYNPIAFLAPDLVRAAVEGRLLRGIGVERLRDAPSE